MLVFNHAYHASKAKKEKSHVTNINRRNCSSASKLRSAAQMQILPVASSTKTKDTNPSKRFETLDIRPSVLVVPEPVLVPGIELPPVVVEADR